MVLVWGDRSKCDGLFHCLSEPASAAGGIAVKISKISLIMWGTLFQ
jgi:hypothetical protein